MRTAKMLKFVLINQGDYGNSKRQQTKQYY